MRFVSRLVVLCRTSFTQAKMATKLAEALLARDRAALSRAITLAESRAPRHRASKNGDQAR